MGRISSVLSNLAGRLEFNLPFSGNVSHPVLAPDYAYKIYLTGTSFKAGEEEGLTIPEETLNCPVDTLYFEGKIGENDVDYSYSWDFGNEQFSSLAHPKVFYNSPGSYPVKLIYTDDVGISDTLMQTFIVPHCSNQHALATNGVGSTIINTDSENPVLIYPNPSNGKFTVAINNNKGAKITIEIYDMIGNIIYCHHDISEPTITIDLSGKAKGIYYVKTMMNDQIHFNKIISH